MVNTTTFFETFFKNARYNAILVLDSHGIIRRVNPAFTAAFGWEEEDLAGHPFHILFTEKDRAAKKPDIELQMVIQQGNASDNNYLLNKDGSATWVTGESVACQNEDGSTDCIFKIIHNIHVQKLLEGMLMESQEFVDNIFEAVESVGLLVLDGSMRIIKVNPKFFTLFGILPQEISGMKFADLQHPFWQQKAVGDGIREIIIRNEYYRHRRFPFKGNTAADALSLDFFARPLDNYSGGERQVLLVISDTSANQ